MLAAMRDHANALRMPTLGPEIDNTLLKNAYKQGTDHFKLLPTQADRASFISLIQNEETKPDASIGKCYRWFARKLKAFDAAALEQCKSVVVSRLILVSVVLDESDNPHVVFESLNSKGRDLTQADLIRNYFLMRVHVNEQERVFRNLWLPIQERLGEGATEFIRHYLMLGGTWVRKDSVYWNLKKEADLARSAEEIESYLSRLERFSRYYHAITEPTRAEENLELSVRFGRLKRLDVTTAHPLLMAMYDDFASGGLSLALFVESLDLIENFILRRSVCSVATNDVNRWFPGVFAKVKQQTDFVDALRKELATRRYPRDNDLPPENWSGVKSESRVGWDVGGNMARKRWKPDEIVGILREADRLGSNEEVIRKHGIAEQTFYRWKKMYGGVDGTELAKLKKLEDENRRLKQLAGDQALALQLMREELGKRGWA